MTEKINLKNISMAIVKDNDGSVLIIKRRKKETGIDGGQLNWAFPGGYIESDEDALKAAARETLIETGYSVSPLKQISERIVHQFGVHIDYIECALKNKDKGPIIEEDEVEESLFVSPNELKNYFTTNIDVGVSKYLGL